MTQHLQAPSQLALIVSDENDLIESLRSLIKSLNHVIHIAKTKNEALDLLHFLNPAVIFMALKDPESSLELAHFMRNLKRCFPVVFIPRTCKQGDYILCNTSGLDPYICIDSHALKTQDTSQILNIYFADHLPSKQRS